MRDGGEWRNVKTFSQTQQSWKSISLMKRDEEMKKTQTSMSNRLSLPKGTAEKY